MKILLDVCFTLFDSNTTFDFFKYLREEKDIYFKIKYIVLRLLGGLLPYYSKILIVRLLRGESVDYINVLANRFYDAHLNSRIKNQVLEIAHSLGNESDFVLISASIDPIISVISTRLKVDKYFCSKLEVLNGKYTGKILLNIRGEDKGNIIKDYYGDIRDFYFFTDSYDDKSLIEIINPSRFYLIR